MILIPLRYQPIYTYEHTVRFCYIEVREARNLFLRDFPRKKKPLQHGSCEACTGSFLKEMVKGGYTPEYSSLLRE